MDSFESEADAMDRLVKIAVQKRNRGPKFKSEALSLADRLNNSLRAEECAILLGLIEAKRLGLSAVTVGSIPVGHITHKGN